MILLFKHSASCCLAIFCLSFHVCMSQAVSSFSETMQGDNLSGATQAVQIVDENTDETIYTFNGNGLWSDPANWVANLVAPTTIDAGIHVIIDHVVPGICYKTGDIAVTQLGILEIKSGRQVTINDGDLDNSGNIIGIGLTPGKISFVGTAANAFNCTGSISATLVLANNKKLFLSGHSLANNIELSGNSKFTLGKYNLDIDVSTVISDNSSFFVTSDTGRLIRYVDVAVPKLFPVGKDSSSYTPVTITNSGSPDKLRVRVDSTIHTTPLLVDGIVKRTWYIDSTSGGSNNILQMQWNIADEAAGFDRSNSYISQSHGCEPPPNCVDTYYDIIARSAATGTGPFIQTRTAVIKPTTFIIKSVDTFRFVRAGNWNDPQNWSNGYVPSNTIENWMAVIIEPIEAGGECILDNNIFIKPRGILRVQPGKKLTVRGE